DAADHRTDPGSFSRSSSGRTDFLCCVIISPAIPLGSATSRWPLDGGGLQPTDAKPGPAFIKRFCGFHKPGEIPSGLYSGPFLDSQQTERPATLTTFASLSFAQMRLSARSSRSPSRYDRLRFGCATHLGRRGEQGLSLPPRGVCWVRPHPALNRHRSRTLP